MRDKSDGLIFSALLILMFLCSSELPVFFGNAFVFHASASASDQPANSSVPDGKSVVATATKLPVKVIDPDGDKMIVSFHQAAVPTAAPLGFTIVALPDTQYYSEDYPWIFDNQTQWVVDNVERMNIVFVSQEGDIVNTYTDLSQWNNANHSLSMLDNHVPWGVLPGYNDGVYAGNLSNYNNYFGYDRFSGESWYGDGYASTNTNSFQLFSVGEDQYLIFHFQYNPSNSVLRWADMIIGTHPGRRVIVVTHNYLSPDGTRTSIGANIWQKLVQPHADQIFLVLCASEHAVARRTDVVGGNPVYQLLANYQTDYNGGNGWLRIHQFDPVKKKIYVKTYSPYLNSFKTDSDSEFTLNYNMTAPSYSLTVNVTPTGSGTVSLNNTGPYYYGDQVKLTAFGTSGWTFSLWSGDLTGNVNPDVITMNANKTVSAAFTYHDVAVTEVTPSSILVYAGNKLSVNVTVKNKGLNTESFNVTLFCNTTSITTQSASNLTPNFTATLTFVWNTSGYIYGYYNITAYAAQVLGEINTSDNSYTYGNVLVTLAGDMNGDGDVDCDDFIILAGAYGSTIGQPAYNSAADIDGDGDVDYSDFIALAGNYGKHWP